MLALGLLSAVSNYVYISYIVAFGLSCLGLGLTYYFVPLSEVRFINAIKAGVIAGIMLEVVKYSVYGYLFVYSNLEVIYGTLSTLMLLLFWVYIAWTIILFGGSVCHTLDSES